ncbi:MAG: aquaporin family protein [Micrococcales bacterium]|nr:aquaporin family protein [Micrococcales bacterium]
MLAETVGTGLLVAIVVGSGIAAQRLSPSDTGLQLLENALATAMGLAVLIVVLQPVSGAHLNPVVTIADRALGAPGNSKQVLGYVVAQCSGAVGGAVLANAMFSTPTTLSTTDRATPGHLLAEVVATAGLVLVIFALARTRRSHLVGPAVGAYIGAACWFTSSTSFANPAVTLGRVFTDTFAGIAPTSVGPYALAQLAGAGAGVGLVLMLFPGARKTVRS